MSRPTLAINSGSCREDNCGRKAHCRGVCARHYRRMHYVEHERARRGHKPSFDVPIGATRINSGGYVAVKVGPGRNWRLQHRLVMESLVGRRLRTEETVHHINGDKTDNGPTNLELWSSRHPKGQRVEDLLDFARQIIDLYGAAA